jgi:hypothetical protein
MRPHSDALIDFVNGAPSSEERHDHILLQALAKLIVAGKRVLSGEDAMLVREVCARMSEAARLRIGVTWTTVRHRQGAREVIAPQLWLNLRGQHLPEPISERAARAYVMLWVVLVQRYSQLMPRTAEHQWLMRVCAKRSRSLLQQCEACQRYFLAERKSGVYCSPRCRKQRFLDHHRANQRRQPNPAPESDRGQDQRQPTRRTSRKADRV